MGRAPEPSVGEFLQWIAYERDAAWAAKLVILRLPSREDIAFFGECLREHERHADELTQLVRLLSPEQPVPDGPCFVTRDAQIIGALDWDEAVLESVRWIEVERIRRYERRLERRRKRGGSREQRAAIGALEVVLERHLIDARARLAAFRRLHSRDAIPSGAAA